MPRGVPKSGKRAPRGSKKAAREAADRANIVEVPIESTETDAEIEAKLEERFGVLEELAMSTVLGDSTALIVSGPAGLGKSFTVERVANDVLNPDQLQSASGFVRATGLRRMLYNARHPGSVVILDDADSVWFDDICLNMLKKACDTTERRVISWMAESLMEDEDGDIIPRQFEFEGSVVFITNYDFDALIEKGHRLAPHFEAMISRAHYIDLAMKTKRDYLVRMRQVVALGMLREQGYSADVETDVMTYVEENYLGLRELSLRMVLKLASLRKSRTYEKFTNIANVTCCKARR